jgi:1,4-dihydroxy-6-naphthoate synthase
LAERLHLGISTCPNDTFAFHALLTGEIEIPGVELHFELRDVQELNDSLAAGRYDIAKGSFFAALVRSRELYLLRAGAALGFGNGPLVLAAPGVDGEPGDPILDGSGTLRPPRVLGPGRWTTACLLYSLLHPGEGVLEQALFSEIMPALERKEADFGICIHEGRFTYAARGLQRVEDLGASWERLTGQPLPLGGIFARKHLSTALIAEVEAAIGRSIEYSRRNPERALCSMRCHAQGQSDEVLMAHVELYVNEHTRWLGGVGETALRVLEERARENGLIGEEQPTLEVFGS